MPGRAPWYLLLGGAILHFGFARAEEAAWEKFENCRVVESSQNDGDSVEIDTGKERLVVRFYFVDCIEKSPHSRERRAQQAKYFGLKEEGREEAAVQAAYEAAKFTQEQLSKPFTVYTRRQKVDSSGENPSVRAFVQTADGEFLDNLLVGAGLAIIREGKAASDRPDGKSAGEIVSKLRALETQARLEGKGAWALAGDPQRATAAPANKGEFVATDRAGLLGGAGHPARVTGRIAKIAALPSGRITFVDFEGNQQGDFVGVIRSDFLPLFHEQFPDGLEKALAGKNVTVEGVITLYRNTPQIELQRPAQIQILPSLPE